MSFTVIYAGQDPKGGLRFYAESEDNPMMVASDSWPDNVRHWFPCNDYPNDKVTNELIATVPSAFKVASNGRLESVTEDQEKGTSTWHWVQDLPHSTYLIVLGAAPYVVVRDNYGNHPHQLLGLSSTRRTRTPGIRENPQDDGVFQPHLRL